MLMTAAIVATRPAQALVVPCFAQSVASLRHQDGAGMSPLAFEPDAQGRRRGDGRHGADRDFFAFEKRPLLDVKLDKRGVIAGS